MDLSGKLIIKASLGDDIRRIPIHNEELTYDELILMMQRVFRGKLETSDDITLKYKDEDGDLITIFDSADVACAIQFSRILKLTLFLNGKSTVRGAACGGVAPDVKVELRAIRDKINQLLDEVSDKRPDTEGGPTATANELDALESKMATASFQQLPHNGTTESKEFDPLQRANSIDSRGIADDQQSVSSQHTVDQQQQPQSVMQPIPQQQHAQVQQPPQVQPDVQQVPPQQVTQQQPQMQQVAPSQTGAYQPPSQQLPGAMPQPVRPPASAMYPQQPGYQRPPGATTAQSPRPAYPPVGAPQAMPPRMTQSPAVAQPASAASPVPQAAYQAPQQAPATSAYQGYQGYSPQQPQQQQQWQGNQQQTEQPPASAYQPGAATATPPISAPAPGGVLGAPPAGPPMGGANPYAKAPGQAFYR